MFWIWYSNIILDNQTIITLKTKQNIDLAFYTVFLSPVWLQNVWRSKEVWQIYFKSEVSLSLTNWPLLLSTMTNEYLTSSCLFHSLESEEMRWIIKICLFSFCSLQTPVNHNIRKVPFSFDGGRGNEKAYVRQGG